jgi:hypothetical protein
MSEQNKYFTPSIEDIRVGYECEELMTGGSFEPSIIDSAGVRIAEMEIPSKAIRVPYLTKEQIEAEGWEVYEKDPQKRYDAGLMWGSMGFTKNNYFLRWNITDKSISIILLDPSRIEGLYFNSLPEHFKCTCSCKDINTFRYICKLLKI